ncbi:hypothetical protein ACWGKU_06420, partial [Kitasatospora sp. NPDC054768]
SATAADGRTVGPLRLLGVPGRPGTYTTREILPAGHWQVTVDCAFPSLGHAQRELDVADAVIDDPVPAGTAAASPPTGVPSAASTGTDAGPVPVPTGGTVSEPAPAGSAPAAASGSASERDTSDSATWAAAGTAVVAVLLVGTGLWLRRRRRA